MIQGGLGCNMQYLILRLWDETRVIDQFNKMCRITDLHHSLQLSYTFGTLQPYNNNTTQIKNRNHMQIIRSFTCLLGKTIIQNTWYIFYSSMKNWAPKRIFMIEKGDLVETETGLLEEERAKFLESDFFKEILKKTQTT